MALWRALAFDRMLARISEDVSKVRMYFGPGQIGKIGFVKRMALARTFN